MELKKEFWDEFGLDLVVDGEGRLLFTAPGRTKHEASFAKWGMALTTITTLSEFKRAIRRINTLELEENNQKLAACLADPSVPEAEKEFIRKLLGPIALAGARRSARKAIFAPSKKTTLVPGAKVVHVDFKTRRVVES